MKQAFVSKGKKEHWLDNACDKYGDKLVNDIKSVLKVLVIFIPVPFYWALTEQVGTAWVFQARRMNGNIGFYTILPDQMNVLDTILPLIMIPIFQYGLYPLLSKSNILKSPVQKVICGGVLVALSYVIAGIISLIMEQTYPILPSEGNGQLRIYNTLPCDIAVDCPMLNSSSFIVEDGHYYKQIYIEVSGNGSYPYEITSECYNYSGIFEIIEEGSIGYFLEILSQRQYRLLMTLTSRVVVFRVLGIFINVYSTQLK